MAESYYDRLGVSRDASTEEIRDAFREQLVETHPDVSDDADAGVQTRRLIEARDVLVDDEERARYDRLGHDRYVGSSGDTAGDTAGQTDDQRGTRDPEPDQGVGRDRDTDSAGAGGGRTRTDTGPEGPTADRTGADANWRTGDADQSFTIGADGSSERSRLFPLGQSLVLLAATFVCYPLLLWGTLLPAVPLVVNLTGGACLLMTVAYLQSIPEVGIVVFGVWSLVLPALLAVAGVELVSVLGAAVLAATVLPLGLSVLTRVVMAPVR